MLIYSGFRSFSDHVPADCPWDQICVRARNTTNRGAALMEPNSMRETETMNKDHANQQGNIEPWKLLSNQGRLIGGADIFTKEEVAKRRQPSTDPGAKGAASLEVGGRGRCYCAGHGGSPQLPRPGALF